MDKIAKGEESLRLGVVAGGGMEVKGMRSSQLVGTAITPIAERGGEVNTRHPSWDFPWVKSFGDAPPSYQPSLVNLSPLAGLSLAWAV